MRNLNGKFRARTRESRVHFQFDITTVSIFFISKKYQPLCVKILVNFDEGIGKLIINNLNFNMIKKIKKLIFFKVESFGILCFKIIK